MKITKNWFYKTSELKTKTLEIEDNLNDIVIFDDDNNLEKIEVWKNSSLNYFSYFHIPESYKKHIVLNWKKSICSLNSIISSKHNSLKLTITWEVASDNSKIDMNILSLVSEWWFIDLDGIIKINQNLEKIEWYLKETNIYLWSKWKIKSIPRLLVSSNDVKASHACKIEKISDKDLFYLRSRWIEKENAIHMMLRNYISSIFYWLWNRNQGFCSNLVENIFENI